MLISIIILFWIAIFLETNSWLNEKQSKIIFIFFILLLIFIESIRNYSGVDFEMYYYSFVRNAKEGERFEPFYTFLEDFFRRLTPHYHLFLLFISSSVYLIYFFVFKKSFKFPLIALYFLFVYNIGMLGSNRQIIATAFCFLSFYVLSDKKFAYRKLSFLALVIIASNFHITALFFLPIIFFNHNIKYYFWIFLLMLALFLNYDAWNVKLVNLFKPLLTDDLQYRVNLYLKEKNTISYPIFFLGIIRRVFPIFLITYFKSFFGYKTNYFLVLNILYLSLLLYLSSFFNFSFVTSRLPYFLFIEIFVYTWFLEEIFIRNYRIKNYTLFLFLIFGLILFYKNISQYIDLFIPYKSILF